jgi:hypothetical protein
MPLFSSAAKKKEKKKEETVCLLPPLFLALDLMKLLVSCKEILLYK